MRSTLDLPDSESPDLHLSHPTSDECTQISTNTASSWKDALPIPTYLDESRYLTTIPLARDRGMTEWILVDKNLPPNQRQILCSCESFRKRALSSDSNGNVHEGIVHGIASVFCPQEYRGRGYGARHMKELAVVLRTWQSEHGKNFGSVLYSDIGREYYARLGWIPNPRNSHLELRPVNAKRPTLAHPITESDLEALCLRDKAMVREAMAIPHGARRRVVILPDLDHMLWHIRKEDFAANYIFGKKAAVKGAISGSPGKQVWAVWVRRYYEHPDHPSQGQEHGGNVLYILRLVIEGDVTANKPREDQPQPSTHAFAEQATAVEAVLRAAQAEAAEWRLDCVKWWDPSPLAEKLVEQSGLGPLVVERHEDAIGSALWFEEDGNSQIESDAIVWINNEHYAWC